MTMRKLFMVFVLVALLFSAGPGVVLAEEPLPPLPARRVAPEETSGCMISTEMVYSPAAKGLAIQPQAIVPGPGGKRGEARSELHWRNYIWFVVEILGKSSSRVLDGQTMDYLWVKGTLNWRGSQVWSDVDSCSGNCDDTGVSSLWYWVECPGLANEHGDHRFKDNGWDSGIVTTNANVYFA